MKNKRANGRELGWRELEAALLQAHNRANGKRLAALYHQAGCLKEKEGDEEGAAFFFTHAYVFALECGDDLARRICGILVRLGRESDM